MVVVSSVPLNGGIDSAAPRFAPSNLNCTPATATLSDATAETSRVPDTMAPSVGAVIETEGGVVSPEPPEPDRMMWLTEIGGMTRDAPRGGNAAAAAATV